MLSTNLFSFYNVTRPLLQPMIRHKHGDIINTVSLSRVKGLLFCGSIGDPKEIEDNAKLQEAYEMGKQV